MQNSPKNISSKDGISREFLEIDSSSRSSKKEFFKSKIIVTWFTQNKFTFHPHF